MAIEPKPFMEGDVPAYSGKFKNDPQKPDAKMLRGRVIKAFLKPSLGVAGALLATAALVAGGVIGSHYLNESTLLHVIEAAALAQIITVGTIGCIVRMHFNTMEKREIVFNQLAEPAQDFATSQDLDKLHNINRNKKLSGLHTSEFSPSERENYKIIKERLKMFALQELRKLTDNYVRPADESDENFKIKLENLKRIIKLRKIDLETLENTDGVAKYIELRNRYFPQAA